MRKFPLAPALLVFLAACGSADEQAPADAAAEPFRFIPTGTDVLLATLERGPDGAISIGETRNATERVGYDNQPYFTPDGAGFWYTAQDDHTGQTDIYRYDLEAGTVERVTASVPESEYSATPLPDGSGISVIRVEADSTQRLWRIGSDGSESVLLPDLAPVGYHKWADASTLVMFVLGQPATLRIGNTETGEVRTVAENIGRSIHLIPGTGHLSFVQRDADGGTMIRRLDPVTGESTDLAPTVAGGDFHAWTPDGALLMADGARLMSWHEDTAAWTEVADLSEQSLTLSRLAVSPDGRHIALVAEAAR